MKSKWDCINYRNAKILEDFKEYKETHEYTHDSLKDTFMTFIEKSKINNEEYFNLPFKLLRKIGDSIQSGTYFSKNFFIRKEIW